MLYTVIIPCYNSEYTIENAIRSLPNNSETIEIIVVNDGSTDKTEDKINKLSKEYKNIKLINQTNQGAGEARKTGVLNATGSYITFLDSDDMLNPEIFSIFDNIINKYNNIDIIRFTNENFTDENEILSIINNPNINYNLDVMDKKTFIDKVICNEIIDGHVSVTLWGKLYRKELFIASVKDYGKNILEDYYINMQYYTNVNSCIDIDKPLYYWRETNTSTSHKYHLGTPEMIETIHKYKINCINNLKLDSITEITRANNWLIRFCDACLYLLQSKNTSCRRSEYKKIDSILKKFNVYQGCNDTSLNTKILKTRLFFLIDLFYSFRYHKHNK